MADKDTVSTKEGTETNEVIGQKDDQFSGASDERPEDQPSPASHATKGMTVLGYSEASRIEDSAIASEKERARFEKASSKEKD